MSLTNATAAYEDCYTLYRLAIDSPRGAGVRKPFPLENDARFFALRMNHARLLQRRDNRRIYPAEHHLHNTSEFDHLQVIVRPDSAGEWWVIVKPHAIDLSDVEFLADDEPAPSITADHDQLLLTHGDDLAS